MVARGERPADASAAAEIWLRARRGSVGAIPPSMHTDEETRAFLAQRLRDGAELWLAQADGSPAGMLLLAGEWIEQLMVEPSLTNRGIGSRLLDAAKRERPDGLRLWTFVSNSGAQRFYERHGFVEVTRTDGSGNEERAPDIQYAWPAG